jgi:predicted transcriptional regulator
LAAGTEVGKYRLLPVLLLPLYTRLHREEILDNEPRGMIRGCIISDPGIRYNEIQRRCGLGNGKAAYHLQALEREGIIRSRSDGRLRRFYPAEMRLVDAPVRLDRLQRLIFDFLRERDGLSQREIAGALGISTPTVSRNMKRMAEMGVVRLERRGITVRCFVAELKEQTGQ